MAKDRWTDDTYTVREVVYGLGLPQTVVVEDGFYAEDEQFSMANGDVLKFLSVIEKQFITATTKRTENDIAKTMSFPSECSSLIHVPEDGTSTEIIVKSIKKVTEKLPDYIRLDCDLKALDESKKEVALNRGVYLEPLEVVKNSGLACRFRGNTIYLQQKTKGQFTLVSQNSVYELNRAIKRFSFPFQGYFVEENPNSTDTSYCCVDFLRVETKAFLLCNSVLPTEQSVRCSVISAEQLLPLDSEEVIQTEVRVKESQQQDPRSKKSASLGRVPSGSHLMASAEGNCDRKWASLDNRCHKKLDIPTFEETMYTKQNVFQDDKMLTNWKGNCCYELASSIRKKGKPPAPPPRTVSVLSEDCPSQPGSFLRMKPQDKNTTEGGIPPKLPPRHPPKAAVPNRKCDITLKSGTSDVPISLKILTKPSQKDIPLYQNRDNNNSDPCNGEEKRDDDDDDDDGESAYIKMKKNELPNKDMMGSRVPKASVGAGHSDMDSEDDESQYMKMGDIAMVRKVTGQHIPKNHRKTLFAVHDQLRKKPVSLRPVPRVRHRLPPVPRKSPVCGTPISPSNPSLSTNPSLPPPKPTHVVPPNVRRGQENTSAVEVKEFGKMSVEELIECFKECKLPKMAEICASESLDGSFLEYVTHEELSSEPFCLSSFHIKKLEQIKSGWRPSHIVG
ncbi:hypothetical protein FSP39_012428 [Pinctada imbricata]|uniref:CABIT domain-containing protein n=1 Tax=Pinctada imbricata TaxID=66713 RepID=A0AA88XYM7_PINIB|nr:hypothetical protein FSP39_012428 [Pinctada imbricata]